MSSTRESIFTRIFTGNSWRGTTSVSGPGSSLSATRRIREWLPEVIRRHGIRSLNDAPCGDGIWISDIRKELEIYRGYDIVDELIAKNRQTPELTGVRFDVADVVTDVLPKADAILCRDCLVHLSFDDGRAAIEQFKRSGSTLLIATTFPRKLTIEQKAPGGWRPVNLEFEPYNLGSPIELFFERLPRPDDVNNDKALGIWLLQ